MKFRLLKTVSLCAMFATSSFVYAVNNIEVWKSPTCGCCNFWIDHLKQHGFNVTANDTGNAHIHNTLQLKPKLQACHSAVVDGYLIEGHVPAQDIERLLKEKPADAVGLIVPEMPLGSPGMDQPKHMGHKDKYDVLLLKKDGTTTIFNSYN
ncbi:DUF411 domain-containing protein [Actinobacillus genomosp. 1]|uniref:DUF411 domain-containing protein n=1 Tax=Actinobacillus genomosp. 1 TaxID=254839 RepID=UPI0024435F94|nr:DUF411 domain-containing protein [Actinobacillus genomosp. 1]WGE35262.1 DUF411 domain-containing protein [Actinobacillus genomosp. 1]